MRLARSGRFVRIFPVKGHYQDISELIPGVGLASLTVFGASVAVRLRSPLSNHTCRNHRPGFSTIRTIHGFGHSRSRWLGIGA
jgi:hypothetical protein